MGISRATFYRRKMRPNKPKSDNSLSFGFDLCWVLDKPKSDSSF
jgi:hypothetical protein